MKQNNSNHTRLHPLYHYFLIPLTVIGLVWSIIQMTDTFTYENLLIVLLFIGLAVAAMLLRTYALMNQDRIIKCEENMRYYMLTGKPLPTELKHAQIIALRFASDAEFVQLVNSAIQENLSPKAIKSAIKNWKGDYRRI